MFYLLFPISDAFPLDFRRDSLDGLILDHWKAFDLGIVSYLSWYAS
jgi:hypothetical protein